LVARISNIAAARVRYDDAVSKLFLVSILVTAAALPAAQPAQAASVRVADGDTIELGNQRIRLQGIDAPELHQECRDAAGRNWPCGRRAQSELRKLIGNNPVQCEQRTRDRFNRSVAVCRVGGRDLGEAMVRAGFAFAYPDWASPYGAAEADARSRKAGLWSGTFQNPRAWRDQHPRDGATPVGRHAGDIIPRATQDWLRERSQAARQSVAQWWRSLWTGKAEAR
jgi:endonuclease YncB( thermonuclease family)